MEDGLFGQVLVLLEGDDDDARSSVCLRKAPETLVDPLVKADILRLEAVGAGTSGVDEADGGIARDEHGPVGPRA